MRKITKESAIALLRCDKYNNNNTQVNGNAMLGGGVMNLHGNTIAIYNRAEGLLTIRDSGWQSNTTKERLNGILDTFGTGQWINQAGGVWYINTPQGRELWNGHATLTV